MTGLVCLELCAGEGGSTKGLLDAGFSVIATDNDKNRLKHNPAEYKYVVDAFDALLEFGPMVNFVWAGFPCQGYSAGTRSIRRNGEYTKHDRLIAAGREAIIDSGLPYVMENVEGARAEFVDPILLCGRMFDLGAVDEDGTKLVLDRHRLFETSMPLVAPVHERHDRTLQVAGVYGGARTDKAAARHERHGGYTPPSLRVQQELLGIDWMTKTGMKLSIPPVYGEFLGRQVVEFLDSERKAAS